jgi:hypothetical protein
MGQSLTTPTTRWAPKVMPSMAGTRSETQPLRSASRIKRRAGSSAGAGTILTTKEDIPAAGMIPITMEVIGMATTRPVTMKMSMLTREASISTHTILKKAHSKDTRRISRTIRRLPRRNLMMSPSARAGTR